MGKINVSALAFKNINLQYERKISNRATVALGYSTIPTSGLAFRSAIEKQINNDNVNISEFKLGTSIITPEFRYYFGEKGAFHGFYLAPYARFGTYKIAGPISYSSSTGVTRSALFDGKVNMIGGGLMMGSSWNLTKSLYLDWWIAGASYGGATGNISAATPLDKDEQIALKRELDKVQIPLTSIESEVSATGATVRTTGNVVGVRGFGINLGMRF